MNSLAYTFDSHQEYTLTISSEKHILILYLIYYNYETLASV